jgi:ubiquinone/menaquinone biosynthesis C-methylase UbiE
VWAPLAVLAALCGVVAYVLVVVTEGVHLGPAMVRRLYDKDARRYEAIKGFDRREERDFLALPLFHRLDEGAGQAGRVLDVACGTGRLATALLDVPFYEGTVVGLDASEGMLAVAAERLARWADRTVLLAFQAPPLPFADGAFDAVCIMEALEFIPHRAATLAELARVLAPGGSLLASNRRGWERPLFLGHARGRAAFEADLAALGLEDVRTQPWQAYYDLVWARKPGRAGERSGGREAIWPAVVRCPGCGSGGGWGGVDPEFACPTCGQRLVRYGGLWRFG